MKDWKKEREGSVCGLGGSVVTWQLICLSDILKMCQHFWATAIFTPPPLSFFHFLTFCCRIILYFELGAFLLFYLLDMILLHLHCFRGFSVFFYLRKKQTWGINCKSTKWRKRCNRALIFSLNMPWSTKYLGLTTSCQSRCYINLFSKYL